MHLAIRFVSYSGTNYSELFGCNRIIRNCWAAINKIKMKCNSLLPYIVFLMQTYYIVFTVSANTVILPFYRLFSFNSIQKILSVTHTKCFKMFGLNFCNK